MEINPMSFCALASPRFAASLTSEAFGTACSRGQQQLGVVLQPAERKIPRQQIALRQAKPERRDVGFMCAILTASRHKKQSHFYRCVRRDNENNPAQSRTNNKSTE